MAAACCCDGGPLVLTQHLGRCAACQGLWSNSSTRSPVMKPGGTWSTSSVASWLWWEGPRHELPVDFLLSVAIEGLQEEQMGPAVELLVG